MTVGCVWGVRFLYDKSLINKTAGIMASMPPIPPNDNCPIMQGNYCNNEVKGFSMFLGTKRAGQTVQCKMGQNERNLFFLLFRGWNVLVLALAVDCRVVVVFVNVKPRWTQVLRHCQQATKGQCHNKHAACDRGLGEIILRTTGVLVHYLTWSSRTYINACLYPKKTPRKGEPKT